MFRKANALYLSFFLYLAKFNRLRPTYRLVITVMVSAFLYLSSYAQSPAVRVTDYERGYKLWYYDKWDSAFLMFNRYVNNPDDTLKKGAAYKFIGEMQWHIGDLYGAQQSLTNAVNTLDPANKKYYEELGIVYNVLGNVSLDLKRYDEAINFFNSALTFVKGSGYVQEVLNGKAIALQRKGDYTAAIKIYDSILGMRPTDQSLLARIIDNRATTEWRQQPGSTVLPEFHAALKIRQDGKFNFGLNASYAHLSDYYTNILPDSALVYASKMRELAIENKRPDDELEAIDKLIRLTRSPEAKLQWYTEFKTLNDSVQFSRDTTRNRFALIRYDVQKSKADNLVLQQHITNQQLAMVGLVALAIAIFAGLYVWYNKRRKRIKQESDDALSNARLKTSQRVHDVVANGLYGIMNELEHRSNLERETLISKIEDLYEKSRNISYEDSAVADYAGYDKQVHDLLTAFANEQTKVIVVGNQSTFWERVSSQQKQQLQLILNEIMINMTKHSRAKNVVIQFKAANDKGFIHYKDDGVGLVADQQFGNGLNNTVSRIKLINGDVSFGSNVESGVTISINFPLQS